MSLLIEQIAQAMIAAQYSIEGGAQPVKIDDANATTTYLGFTENINVSNSSPSHLIARVTTAGSLKNIEWASQKYDQIWNDRVGLFATPAFDNSASILVDGVNDYVDLGNEPTLNFVHNSVFSISVWFRTTGTSPTPLISKQGNANNAGWRLATNSGELRAHLSGGSSSNRIEITTQSAAFADGFWHHVVWTYSGSGLASGMKLYVDGIDQALTVSQDGLSTSPGNSINAQISGRNGTSEVFDGFIDEISIWNTDLDSTEAAAIYNSGAPGDLNQHSAVANLQNWWRLGDQDIFPTLVDVVSGVNGTMTNMVSSQIVGEVP